MLTNEASTKIPAEMHDRPLASPGLVSYRCKSGYYGWIMIGARDHADAMNEAIRSYHPALRKDLEIWDGEKYVPVPMPTEHQIRVAIRKVMRKEKKIARLAALKPMHRGFIGGTAAEMVGLDNVFRSYELGAIIDDELAKAYPAEFARRGK